MGLDQLADDEETSVGEKLKYLVGVSALWAGFFGACALAIHLSPDFSKQDNGTQQTFNAVAAGSGGQRFLCPGTSGTRYYSSAPCRRTNDPTYE